MHHNAPEAASLATGKTVIAKLLAAQQRLDVIDKNRPGTLADTRRFV